MCATTHATLGQELAPTRSCALLSRARLHECSDPPLSGGTKANWGPNPCGSPVTKTACFQVASGSIEGAGSTVVRWRGPGAPCLRQGRPVIDPGYARPEGPSDMNRYRSDSPTPSSRLRIAASLPSPVMLLYRTMSCLRRRTRVAFVRKPYVMRASASIAHGDGRNAPGVGRGV